MTTRVERSDVPAADRSFFGPQIDVRALEFSGVTMRVFPLLANPYRLERFCRDYLLGNETPNDVPEQFARFHPLAPYVLFMVINYGRMTGSASNLGWVAQNEILFSIPLSGHWHETIELDDGRTELRRIEGLATVSPFIWVDNEWSITTGREVYGWPKYVCRITPEVNPWLRDPRRRRRLMALKTPMFSRLYAGQPLQPRMLIELEQEVPRIVGQFPPQMDQLLSPLAELPQTFMDLMSVAPESLRFASRLWTAGTGMPLVDLLGRLWDPLSRGEQPDLFANTVNLKQFRASRRQAIAYQSLVLARMAFKRFHAGGMLGSVEQARGDLSGGFRLFIHRSEAFPILESLGLKVDNELESEGDDVAMLQPVLPFWLSADVRYERARRICWRTQESSWAIASERPEMKPEPERLKLGTLTPFNTTLGPLLDPVEGPFDFPNTTIRVLPLIADHGRLSSRLVEILGLSQQVIVGQKSLELHRPFKLDPSRSLVLLVVTNYEQTSSAVNDLGWWGGREVALAVVLECANTKDCFLFWPYMFSDSAIAVTEGREVLGLPTTYAEICGGEDRWIQTEGPGVNRLVMTVSARDLPAAGLGLEARERCVLEIEQVAGSEGERKASTLDRLWQENSKIRQSFRTGLRFSNLSLKQFRDEEDPSKICWRSLVRYEKRLGRWIGADPSQEIRVEPLRGRYEVRIHDSPLLPITEELGLLVSRRDQPRVAVCKVVEPFWIKADLQRSLPSSLLWQSVDGAWYEGLRPRAEKKRGKRAAADRPAGPAPQAMPADMPGAPQESRRDDAFAELGALGELIERLRAHYRPSP